jgi:protein-tyrosine phosphatase
MIDLHNHCLYGVDDGSQSLEDSIKLLRQAYEDGITEIVLTPHFMKNGKYHVEASELLERYNILKDALYKNHIYIELHMGNELYINSSLDTLLMDKKIFSMNNTHYVLVEFPFNEYKDEFDETLYNLTVAGYRVIIAHPERYDYVLDNIDFCQHWLKHGYILQSNQNGLFQTESEKQIHTMIELGYVQLIGTDCHNVNRPCILSRAYSKVHNDFGFRKAEELFEVNPKKVLRDEIVPVQIKKHRRSLLGKYDLYPSKSL